MYNVMTMFFTRYFSQLMVLL